MCVNTSVYVKCSCICCVPGVVGPLATRAINLLFSRDTPIFSHKKYIWWLILSSVFIIMSQGTVSTTAPPVTLVCSRHN